jgi:hypothetical protein
MTHKEERIRILRLLEEGRVSAEDAAKLLAALGSDDRTGAQSTALKVPARWVRIRVTDLSTGRSKVEINVPAELIRLAGRFGARFAPEDVDVEEILDAVRTGKSGQLVDVVDHEDGTHVEVFVE